MATGQRFIMPLTQWSAPSGPPYPGATLTFYITATSTKLDTFTDQALTIANTNPVVADGNGTFGPIWLQGLLYKVVLATSTGAQVWTADPVGGDTAVFVPTATGGISHLASLTRNEFLDVFDFLTDAQIAQVQANSIATDLSTNLQNALNANRPLEWPAGTYACNINLPNAVIMRGAGSGLTIIRPFNTAIAALTNTFKSGAVNAYWNYHTFLEGFGFAGSGQVGVGFTCGKTVPSAYVSGDENVGNMTFKNCSFLNLNKGFQAPFGNIRKQFLDCGWQGNFYGIYNLDAKFGGTMQAGNLYIRGGEFNVNDCAIYVDNVTDGYYPPQITGTIFEGNKCCGRFKNAGGVPLGPVLLNGIGSELNGSVANANVTLDVWTGTVLTTETISTPMWLFDGDRSHGKFIGGGVIGGILLRATNSTVEPGDLVRAESAIGFGGQASSITAPTTSQIVYGDMVADEGAVAFFAGSILRGTIQQSRNIINSSGSGAGGRSNIIPARNVISAAGGGLVGTSVTFNTQQNFSVGPAITGTVTANDGDLYANVNAYTATYSAPTQLAATAIALSAGWWFWSIAGKAVSGTVPSFLFWDESTNQLASFTLPAGGAWHTFGGIGFVASGTPTIALELSGTQSGAATWRLSAFQIRRFDTLQLAQDFMASKVFAV